MEEVVVTVIERPPSRWWDALRQAQPPGPRASYWRRCGGSPLYRVVVWCVGLLAGRGAGLRRPGPVPVHCGGRDLCRSRAGTRPDARCGRRESRFPGRQRARLPPRWCGGRVGGSVGRMWSFDGSVPPAPRAGWALGGQDPVHGLVHDGHGAADAVVGKGRGAAHSRVVGGDVPFVAPAAVCPLPVADPRRDLGYGRLEAVCVGRTRLGGGEVLTEFFQLVGVGAGGSGAFSRSGAEEIVLLVAEQHPQGGASAAPSACSPGWPGWVEPRPAPVHIAWLARIGRRGGGEGADGGVT